MSISGNSTSGRSSERTIRPPFWTRLLLPPDFSPEHQTGVLTWVEALFEPAALIGTVVCFVLGLVSFGLVLSPGWETRSVIMVSIIVGAEAFLYSRRLVRSLFMPREWIVLLVPPIVAVRLLPYLNDPTASLGNDLLAWIRDPSTFFTFAFTADVLILLMVWIVVFSATQCLNRLRVQEGEMPVTSGASYDRMYEDSWRSYDHSSPLRHLERLYVWGGVILVILSALASIGTDQFLSVQALGQLLAFQRPSLHLVLANVLLYFVIGLLLLGEAQLVRQRTLWQLDRLAIPPEIIGRWITGVVGLVAVALVVALILPTGYALTLGDIADYITSIVIEAATYLAAALFYVLYLLGHLLPGDGRAASPVAPAVPPHLPITPPPAGGASPLEALRSVAFWIIALGLVAYSIGVLWRRRSPYLARLPLLRLAAVPLVILRWLVTVLRRMGRRVGQAVAAAVPAFLRQVPERGRRPVRFLTLGRLGPRELVEYFYLSICERAAQLGHPRPPGMTPAEYREVLRHRLPLVNPELDALTEAFIEARYGPRPVSRESARTVRAIWQALKLKLRKARIQRAG
jgi:hypothetical protein